MGFPSTSDSGPAISTTRPTLTWPGMIGYGTPASRPWWRWTSVPQTSLATVSRIAPPGRGLGWGTRRISRGRPGAVMKTASTVSSFIRSIVYFDPYGPGSHRIAVDVSLGGGRHDARADPAGARA